MCERDGLLSDENFYDRSQLLAHSYTYICQLLLIYHCSCEPVCDH